MQIRKLIKTLVPVAGFAGIIAAGMFISSPRALGDDENRDQSKIEIGFKVAPVYLNLAGRNHDLVGLGSYLVNVQSDCNGCHSQGPPTEFTPTGNPYLLPGVFAGKKTVNTKTYLGGGRNFGPFGPTTNPGSSIFSRNLTPDYTGRPEGGHTYAEFVKIMRTGIDMDGIHTKTCSSTVTTGCLPFPFNGALLQVMPWIAFQDMTDDDLRAIYEYLSAIPCIDTIVTGQPQLRNVCPAVPPVKPPDSSDSHR